MLNFFDEPDEAEPLASTDDEAPTPDLFTDLRERALQRARMRQRDLRNGLLGNGGPGEPRPRATRRKKPRVA